MTIGRLTGDRIVSSLGPRKVINAGALTAISGFLITLHTDMWQLALFGYALIGFGCANIVPIMFSATGKQDVMPESMAVTAVSTLGYAGVLAGPALVGFGAEVSSLPVSLHAVVGLMIIALLVSLKIRV
jgi:MFS family permease